MIKHNKKRGEWKVTDHTGKRNFGTYKTEAAAKARLAQIERLKNKRGA